MLAMSVAKIMEMRMMVLVLKRCSCEGWKNGYGGLGSWRLTFRVRGFIAEAQVRR